MTVAEAKKVHEEICREGRDVLIEALKKYDTSVLWDEEQSDIWNELDELNVKLTKDGCFFVSRFKVGKSHRTFTSPLIKAKEF